MKSEAEIMPTTDTLSASHSGALATPCAALRVRVGLAFTPHRRGRCAAPRHRHGGEPSRRAACGAGGSMRGGPGAGGARLLVQRVEGLPDGQAHVQQHHLARLRDELVAAVPAQELAHPIPRVRRLVRLRGRQRRARRLLARCPRAALPGESMRSKAGRPGRIRAIMRVHTLGRQGVCGAPGATSAPRPAAAAHAARARDARRPQRGPPGHLQRDGREHAVGRRLHARHVHVRAETAGRLRHAAGGRLRGRGRGRGRRRRRARLRRCGRRRGRRRRRRGGARQRLRGRRAVQAPAPRRGAETLGALDTPAALALSRRARRERRGGQARKA